MPFSWHILAITLILPKLSVNMHKKNPIIFCILYNLLVFLLTTVLNSCLQELNKYDILSNRNGQLSR